MSDTKTPQQPAAKAAGTKAEKLTLQQRIARKEAELARLKESERKARNKRLILIGIVAEKVALKDGAFNAALVAAARQHLSPTDLEKSGLVDRCYGKPVLPF